MFELTRSFEKFIIDIDVGGTFTDAIISRDNLAEFYKVDTTPHDLSQCFRDVLESAVKSLGLPGLRNLLVQTQVIRVSTSLSTNTLVERKGPRCGLIVSEGLRGPFLSQPQVANGPFPLIQEVMVVEICTGDISTGRNSSYLSEDEVRQQVQALVEKGASIIVVSLDRSDVSADHEIQVKEAIMRFYPRHFLGSVPILLGSQISVRKNFLQRTNTAVLHAYCHKALARRFSEIEEFLRSAGYTRPLLVVHSSGGTARVAKTKAINTINSGWVAVMLGVSRQTKKYAPESIICVDVGGTTTESGVVRAGEIEYTSVGRFEGIPVDLSRPPGTTLGLGGGSIARLGTQRNILLGPDSAGAYPGPACYDLGGTKPTLTDAYLILGYLDEQYFLGGRKNIRKDSAKKVFKEKLAIPLGISCEEAALIVKSLAVEILGHSARQQIDRDGLSAHNFSLCAVGGGGGCIGAELSNYLGIEKTYVFRQGSVFGAYGTSSMDIEHSYERALDIRRFGDRSRLELNCGLINSAVAKLQRAACNDMRGEGFKPEEIHFELELELSSPTVSRPVRIPLKNPFIWPPKDWLTVIELASKKFGDPMPEQLNDVCLSRFYLRARAEVPHSKMLTPQALSGQGDALKGFRPVYGGKGKWAESAVYEWDLLPVPQSISGPAIIESSDTTMIVPPGMIVEIDSDYNGCIRR